MRLDSVAFLYQNSFPKRYFEPIYRPHMLTSKKTENLTKQCFFILLYIELVFETTKIEKVRKTIVFFVKLFSLLKNQHRGVSKGAQSIIFGSFFETKTQQSPSACRKNLICAKCTYFLWFFITFLCAGTATTPWEKQAGRNLGPYDENIAYWPGLRAKVEGLRIRTQISYLYSNLHVSVFLIKAMK